MCSTEFAAPSQDKFPWQRLRQPCCFRKSKFRSDAAELSVRQFWRHPNLAAPQRRILNPKSRGGRDEHTQKASPTAIKLPDINSSRSALVCEPRRGAAEDH